MNIVELVFKAVTGDLDKAKGKIDDVDKSTAKATTSVNKLGDSFDNLKGAGGPIGNAASKIDDVGQSATSALRSVTSLGAGFGTLAGAALTIGTAIVAVESIGFAANKAADDADELAQKLGLTISRLETLKLIANENGGSVEGLQRTYDKLSKSMNKFDEDNEKTTLAFKALVLTQQELANMTEQQIAGVVIKRWQELGMTSKATAATAQILGASFRDNIPSILAASEATSDYADRIRKFASEATPELVEAGGKQEKALSDLGLSWQGLSNEVARWSSNMLTTIISWAASALNAIRGVMAEFRSAQGIAVASANSIPQARKNELLKQSRDEVYDGSNPNANEGDVNKRFKELLSAEQKSNFRRFEVGQSDTVAGAIKAAEEAAKLKAASAKVSLTPGKKGPKDTTAEKAADALSKRGLFDLAQQDKAQADAEALYQKNLQLAASYRDLADPAAQYVRQLEEIRKLRELNLLTADQALEAEFRIQEAIQGTIDKEKKKGEQIDLTAELAGYAAKEMGDGLTAAFTGGEFSFRSFLATMLKGIANLILQLTIIKPLVEWFTNSMKAGGGGWGAVASGVMSMFGMAKGGAFSNGVQKFANGGVVSSPTAFGMAGGKAGVMGEAGPEAIMPLRRDSQGRLGVMAQQGGAPINIQQHVTINGDIDSADRQAKVMREMYNQTKAIVKQTLVDEKRRGGVLA